MRMRNNVSKQGLVQSSGSRTRRTALQTAVAAVLGLAATHASAASATWLAAPTDGDWIPAGTNWSTGAGLFPGATTGLTNLDIATFNTGSAFTTIAINSATLNFGSILFDTNATAYTIGSAGPNLGNAALLSSSGSIQIASTFLGSGITQTINAPLVLQPATGATAGVYTFANNSVTASGSALNFAGNISGGTTTFTSTGESGGAVQLVMGGANGGSNTVSGLISDGGAGSNTISTIGKGIAIQKTGIGTWNLTNANNNYTGVTQITRGILNVASLSDYGVASAIGTRMFDNASAGGVGILLNGGVLQYTGAANQSTNRAIRISIAGGSIDSSGSGTLSFTRTIASPNLFQTGGVRTLALTGSNTGANTFDMALTDQSGNATTLLKTGSGTWTYGGVSSGNNHIGAIAGLLRITNANTAVGNTIAAGGTVRADFTGTNTGAVRLAAASKLVTAGGIFEVLGTNVAGQTTTQTFALTTVTAGMTSIVNTSGGAGLSSTLNLGTFARTRPGGGVDFTLPSVGSTNTTTANALFTGGQQTILGGYATVGGNTWAVSGSGGTPGAISGLAAYNTGFLAGKDVEAGGVTATPAAMTINSLRFDTAGGAAVNSAGALNIATGGILITPNAGNSPIAINNNTLTTGNGVDVVVIHNNPGSNSGLTIGSQLTGTTGFTKLGAGSVTLAAANTFTGNTIVSGGTLNLTGSLTSIPIITNGTFIVGSTGSILAPGVKLAFDTNDISGTIPGLARTVTYNSGSINSTGGDFIVAQTQSVGSNVTGTLYQAAGTIITANDRDMYLALNSAGFTGNTQVAANATGTTFVNGTLNLSGGAVTAGRQFFTGGWRGDVSSQSTSALNLNGGTLTAVNNGGSSFFNSAQSGVINLNAGGTLRTNAWNAGNTPVGGSTVVNFNGGLLQTNATSTDFLNARTSGVKLYVGGATIETAAATSATVTQVISNASNSALTGAGVSGGTSVFTTPQPLVFTGGTGSGASGYATIDGAGQINGIVLTNAGSYTSAPSISIAGYNGSVIQPTLTANSAGGLTKTGTGTLTLTNNSTYNGPTNINAGTLQVNGSLSTSSAVNVNNTGTLTGTPTSTLGSVSVASGGTLTPGNAAVNTGIGTFLTQTLTLSSGSNLNFEFGAGNDMITVGNSGGLNIGGGALSLFAAGTVNAFSTNGTYTLFNTTGGFAGSLANFSITPATTVAGKSYSFSDVGGALQLTIGDALTIEWNGDIDGSWANGANWIGGSPANGLGVTAKFGTALTGASATTVTLNGPKTVGGLIFDNAGSSYTINGADTLTFNNGVVASAIAVANGTHTIAAPIALTNTLNITTTNAIDGLLISGNISGAQPIIVGGLGTVVLTGATNGSTTTTVNGGVLAIGAGGTSGTLGSGNVTIATGGTVALNRSDSISVNNNISGAGTLSMIGTGTATLGGTNSVGTISTSAGTVNLVGSNTGTALTMNSGTVNISAAGSLTTSSGAAPGVIVGNLAAGNAVLNINGGTVVGNTTGGQFNAALQIGRVAGSAGAVNFASGTLTLNQQLSIGSSGAGSYGSYTQTGGTTNVGSFIVVAANNDSAVMNVNGGSLNVNANLITVGAGGAASNGVININGGSVTSTATTGFGTTIGGIFVGENGTGTLNVTGGNLALSGWGLRHGHTGSGNSTSNLLGGTVSTTVVSKGAGLGTLNLNGGTLRATASSATFMQGLTSAYVHSGGANIDDNGNAITIAQALLAPSGSGVTAGGLTVSGTGFIGAPVIQISGGGGTGATAVANVDSNGNLTGITITNPGNDFSSDPTFTILGGGNGNTGSITGSAVLAANVSGGLTKTGSGTTTLTGVSTYTGATAVNNGRLVIGGAGEINASSGISVSSGARLVQISTAPVAPTVTVNGGTLDGTGTVNTAVIASNAISTVANGNGGTGVFTVGTLTFNGTGVLNLNTASNAPVLNVTTLETSGGGGLSTGIITVNANNTIGWTTGQVYDLVSYGTLGGVGFADFLKGTVTGLTPRQSATLTNPAGFISLAITGDVPVWTGLNNGDWTTAVIPSPKNWKLQTAATATDFIANDAVLFDDSAAGTTNVNISTADVSPSSTTFNNTTKNYTISSTGGFGIATGTLTKSGTGTLTLNTANTYTGGTTLTDGTLVLGHSSALGAFPGALTINGGTLDANAKNFTVGALSGTGGTIKDNSGTAGVTTVTVNTTTNTTYSGDIQDGATRSVGLAKMGTGTLTLAGTTANTYTGLTNITAGTLALQKSGGNAIGGNITIGDASGSDVLLLNASDQIADSSEIFLNSGLANNSAFLRLNNVNETIKGISTTTPTAAVIENASPTAGLAILTVDTAGTDYSYNGIIRNGSLGTFGTLGLTKAGAGTLSLTNSASVVVNSFTGGTIVNGGTLQINTGGGTGTLRGTVTVNPGATLLSTVNDSFGFTAGARVDTLNVVGGTVTHTGNAGLTLANAVVTMTGGLIQTTDPTGFLDVIGGGTSFNTIADASTATIAGRIRLRAEQPSTTFNVADGAASTDLLVSSAISEIAPGLAIVKDGAGVMVMSGTHTYTGATTSTGGGKLITTLAIQNNAPMVVSGASAIEVPINGGATGVSYVSSLQLDANGSNYLGKLELHDNDLIVNYGGNPTVYTDVLNMVKSGLPLLGFGGDGTGITSAEVIAQGAGGIGLNGTMLGVIDGATTGGQVTTLSGFAVANPTQSVLVKYTWRGDANLDGVVNGSDYALADTGFSGGGTGWFYGDVNYDGVINGSDYALIDTGFSSQTGPLPEPAMLSLLGLGAMGMLRRRRRTV
ncbi:MAG: autotransporter-associated beta strand repeat-containing protein [Burkholderiales bacterium]|nr:autotransporter-associated beta strand repeat-containing protein [Phycisphaerae bacterium]